MRDVTVARYESVRSRERPDAEVADLYEADPVDAAGDRRGQAPLRPARVDLQAHAGVEAAGDVDHVVERMHEPDVDPQRIRVLDRERHVRGAGHLEDRCERSLERVGRVLPREWCRRTSREHEAAGTEPGRRVDRTEQARALRLPSLRFREAERPETDEVADAQPARDGGVDARDAVVPTVRFELRDRHANLLDAVPVPEREIFGQRDCGRTRSR